MDNREKKIQEGLNKDIYRQVEELNNLEDATVSSTEKLANILDGYLTKIDEESFEEFNDNFEIVDSQNIEIEIDDKDLLKKYNDKLHDGNLETLNDLINEKNIIQDTNIEDFTQNIPDLKDQDNNLETQEIYEVKDSKVIDNEDALDESTLDFEEEKTEDSNIGLKNLLDDKKMKLVDGLLTVAVIVLTLLLLYSLFGG